MDNLLLLSGNDIPFVEAQISIHQPTVKEIGYIGEEAFFTGFELLNFSKNILPEEDKIHLEDRTNFDILIAILGEQNVIMQKNRNCVLMFLTLLFPEHSILFKSNCIELKKGDEISRINNDNFEKFKEILGELFNFDKGDSATEFNPSGKLAHDIAEKLKKRHQKLNEEKDKGEKINILNRYVSILAVGEQKDMNNLLGYTVYQLLDELKRFELHETYLIYTQAQMAGAKDLKEIDDWMKNIHS